MKPGQEFSAVANCHVLGMYSIPLKQNESFVERMFIDTLGNCYQVAPHNHRYDINLEVLTGEINHTVWSPTLEPVATRGHSRVIEMYTYDWKSPLIGGVGRFERRPEAATRWRVDTVKLRKGSQNESISLRAWEVHSLITHPGTSWVVTEYQDSFEDTVTLHQTPDYAPDLSGLYTPIPS